MNYFLNIKCPFAVFVKNKEELDHIDALIFMMGKFSFLLCTIQYRRIILNQKILIICLLFHVDCIYLRVVYWYEQIQKDLSTLHLCQLYPWMRSLEK